jgi:hypothetical protein
MKQPHISPVSISPTRLTFANLTLFHKPFNNNQKISSQESQIRIKNLASLKLQYVEDPPGEGAVPPQVEVKNYLIFYKRQR